MEEIWKDIKEYKGLYQVSNIGRVRRVEHDYCSARGEKRHLAESIKKTTLKRNGYVAVALYNREKMQNVHVHRLVAEAFIPNPENKPYIDHINGDKTDNRVENLRWCTQKENMNNVITLEAFRATVKRGPEHHCYGKKRPKEAIDKFRATMSSRPRTEEEHKRQVEIGRSCPKVRGAKHPRARRIEQYSLDGVLLKTWGCIADAARYYNKRETAIAKNLHGEVKKAFGYVWKYATNPED